MRIIFLRSTEPDIRWFTRYYRHVFPAGRTNARLQMARSLAALRENPLLGRPHGDAALREFVVARTPFILVYRVLEDRIEILRVWDGRANPETRDLTSRETDP